jgi:single-stranded-DNA-specific exonuclease
MPPIETLYSKLSGVTHHNADGTNRQEIIAELCYNGQPLLLMREPNQFSPDNIGVYVAYQIGYVNPDLAKELAPLIDVGGAVDAHITDITGGTEDKPTRGVNVEFNIYD